MNTEPDVAISTGRNYINNDKNQWMTEKRNAFSKETLWGWMQVLWELFVFIPASLLLQEGIKKEG